MQGTCIEIIYIRIHSTAEAFLGHSVYGLLRGSDRMGCVLSTCLWSMIRSNTPLISLWNVSLPLWNTTTWCLPLTARPLPAFYTAISLKAPDTSLERNFIRRWSAIQYCTHTSHTNIKYVSDAFKLRDQITYPERNMTPCSLVETYQSFIVICCLHRLTRNK